MEEKELKKLEKSWEQRRKERKAKQMRMLNEFKKTAKLIFKENKSAIEVTLTATSLDFKTGKKVQGLSWSREELIKPKKKDTEVKKK